jgi:hypothetical protein
MSKRVYPDQVICQDTVENTNEETQLGLKRVGDIAGSFFVPAYQRGYRWDQEQVSLLITDIWENQDKDYCLQPVVVKQRADGRLELIDGQQRLTTLYLILLYMKNERLQNFDLQFTIEYETRPRSGDYLATLDETRKDENVDFFHMYGAYHRIKAWFDGHESKRQHVADKFFGFLRKRVKVIWYEASHDVDSTALFTRLNVGRIPLTNAELVKALLFERFPEDEKTQRPPELILTAYLASGLKCEELGLKGNSSITASQPVMAVYMNLLAKRIALLGICLVPHYLDAQADFRVLGREVQIHGFLSGGLAYSNHYNYLTMTTSQGNVFTEAGLSISSKITDKLHVVAQVYDRYIGELGKGKVDHAHQVQTCAALQSTFARSLLSMPQRLK